MRSGRAGRRRASGRFPLEASALRSRFDDASADCRFATTVMATAEILRGSPWAKGWTIEKARVLARAAAGDKEDRLEFVSLLGKPVTLAAR